MHSTDFRILEFLHLPRPEMHSNPLAPVDHGQQPQERGPELYAGETKIQSEYKPPKLESYDIKLPPTPNLFRFKPRETDQQVPDPEPIKLYDIQRKLTDYL